MSFKDQQKEKFEQAFYGLDKEMLARFISPRSSLQVVSAVFEKLWREGVIARTGTEELTDEQLQEEMNKDT